MILVKRTLPFVIGLATFAGLFLVPVWPLRIWMTALIVAFVVVWGMGSMSGWGADLERWGYVAITPVAFVLSSIAFMLFVESVWLLIAISALVGLFVFFFMEHVFRFVHVPGIYQPYALEHTSLVLHIASMYFLTTTFFGLNTFLQVPIWLLSIGFFFVSAILVYETFWVSKIREKNAARIAAVGGLVLTEAFVAQSFLPTSFFVSAAVMAILFYLFLGVVRASMLHKLSKVVLRRYIATSGVFLLLLYITAKWI